MATEGERGQGTSGSDAAGGADGPGHRGDRATGVDATPEAMGRASRDAEPEPEPLGAPGITDIGPHAPPPTGGGGRPPPSPQARLRTAGMALAAIGAVLVLMSVSAAVYTTWPIQTAGDEPGGSLVVIVPTLQNATIVVRDLHGPTTANGTSDPNGTTFQLVHAHAQVTILHRNGTWVREVFVPAGGTLRVEIDEDDAPTASRIAGTAPSIAVRAWTITGLGVAAFVAGIAARRGRGLKVAVPLAWVLTFFLGTLALTTVLTGAPNLFAVLIVAALAWTALTLRRASRALQEAPPAAPTPPPERP